MKTHAYSRAICALIREGNDIAAILKNVRSLLERTGRVRMLRSILVETIREMEKHERTSRATVTVRSQRDLERSRGAIDAALNALNAGGAERIVEDRSIIGGYSVNVGGKRIDRTYKKRLADLYHAIITN